MKSQKRTFNSLGVEGLYDCKYIHSAPDADAVVFCLLTITKRDEVYGFVWSTDDVPFFVGLGIKVGNNHIAVSYSNPYITIPELIQCQLHTEH
jgi:hypothetical protein